jgi:nucleoside-diphosphate-sugar epimerase
MTSALVGSTGLVGGNLLRAFRFDATFHRPDINRIRGASFDLVVCAAAPAEKWRANAEPDADWDNLASLIDCLEAVHAERFVLVSTIDVYPVPVGVDETTPVDAEANHPYGCHRYRLEEAVRARFPTALVVRLPGVFGPGLKKNLVFDLLHGREESFVRPSSKFQFYDLAWLWGDVNRALDADLRLVNLATPPVSAEQVAQEVFSVELPSTDAPVDEVRYDMRTTWAGLWGREGPYIRTLDEMLEAMRAFVARERGSR